MSEQQSSCAPAEKPVVEYRDIPGFPKYRVGDDGTVWSSMKGEWQQLRPGTRRGYPFVGLYARDARGRTVRSLVNTGVLVLTSFVGPRPPGQQMCHFPDRSKFNNRLSNLRWGTVRENNGHQVIQGTRPAGLKHHSLALSKSQIMDAIDRLSRGERPPRIAKDLGVHPDTIRHILNGRSKYVSELPARTQRQVASYKTPRHNARTKVTVEQVREIRQLAGSMTIVALSKKFSISKTQIAKIKKGLAWKNV